MQAWSIVEAVDVIKKDIKRVIAAKSFAANHELQEWIVKLADTIKLLAEIVQEVQNEASKVSPVPNTKPTSGAGKDDSPVDDD